MALNRRLRAYILACFFSAGIFPATSHADNWQAHIYEYGAPRHVVGVDKKKGVFNFFEKKSPLKVRYSYPCVTGQLPGDKKQINDLRTPEGVYFVEYKIANGLDFREYGGIAYTLNYPNPVDRLRGKTGYGIWIHSKGFELVPTKGCVAIGRANIAEVGPYLLPGTPVVVAEELAGTAENDNGSLATLKGLMAEWTQAWESRSARLFDYYDPDSYSRATENFAAFRLNKERLFKILSFIKIYNREIHALEGPGYWVTWSEQFYTASNLSTEGVRRLYWQKDNRGRFRIVGMEWTPRDLGMAAAFKEGKLVAQATPVTVTDASSEAPTAPRLDMPEQAPAVNQNSFTSSLIALAENLMAISEPILTRQMNTPQPTEIIRKTGQPGSNPIPAQTQTTQQPSKPDAAPAPALRPTPALELPASPASERIALTEEVKQKILALGKAWEEALAAKNANIDDFYDPKDYNRLPASTGVPRGKSLNLTLQNIKKDFRQPWLRIVSRKPQVESNGNALSLRKEMLYITPQGMRQGIQTLWWRKDSKGAFRIVGSDFKPAMLGMEADYLEEVSVPIAEQVESWRKAWEAGDLDKYMNFYTANAIQQGKYGAQSIRKQKESLWGRVRPVEVRLSGLRVALDGNGTARADMTQAYVNSAGHEDKGIKTIYLRFDGNNWLIQRENWANLNQAPAPQ